MKSYILLGQRNLFRRRSRSFLTVLGVILAIGFTVGLLSISEGFMASLDEILVSSGPDLFVMPKGGSKMPMGMQGTALLDENLIQIIRGIPGVHYAEPIYMVFSVDGEGAGFGSMMTMVSGHTHENFFNIRPNAKLKEGRFFDSDDEGNVVVLGGLVAENTKKKIGDELELISGHKLKVIGILETADDPFDFFAYAPIRSMQKLYGDPDKVSYFLVKSDDDKDPGDVAPLLEKAFPNLDIQTVTELVSEAKRMMSIARAIHFGVSCFALVIGVLFVACTMVMSVAERIREFAMLRVIGASRNFVMKMILSESVLLSAVGGVFGCVFGIVLSKLIDLLIGHFVGETFVKTLVSPRIFITGILIAVLIGTLAGIIPAIMILKRNLADSLRYE
ncbi:MAG TPA: ABC transporter permease [bacterium]|nr:ABC transporter permease [bacterium]